MLKSHVKNYGVYHHQRKYPELRLNFESLDSMMLYSRKPSDRLFHYFVNDNHFQVKDTGMKIKFHDLRNAVIHKDISNSSLSAKQKKYTFISTGMCEESDIDNAIKIFKERCYLCISISPYVAQFTNKSKNQVSKT